MFPRLLLSVEEEEKMGFFLAVLTFATCFPIVQTTTLPSFQDLKWNYPGDTRYGGAYDKDKLLELSGLSESFSDVDDTCPLRMSLALNYIGWPHQIIKSRLGRLPKSSYPLNGTDGLFFFNETNGTVSWLSQVYGEPAIANNTRVFNKKQGIMVLKVDNEGGNCAVLLWDGAGFHQQRGFTKHKDLREVQFWETPTSGCGIDINLKQSTCFPSKSLVELFSGEKIAMESLKIGDRVKTFTADGKIVYSPIITFLDQMPDYGGYYHTVIAESQTNVTLSKAHLIFRKEPSRGIKGSLGFHTARALYASELHPDDVIFVHCPQTGAIVSRRVLAVSLAEEKGAYAPVTEEGTLLVNGVWVSCYADLGDHQLAHYLMSPLKSFYGLAPRVLGAGGGYMHGYLKGALRPIGMKLFGEDKFYREL